MNQLRITLFGSPAVARSDAPTALKIPRTELALLAYLALQPRHSIPREVLAELLWGNRSGANPRKCLDTALWRLRRAVEPTGSRDEPRVITTRFGEVGLNRDCVDWLDVAIFETQVKQATSRPMMVMSQADVRQLHHTVQLYTGELMDGFYDDWVISERERFRMLYLNGLARLMESYRFNQKYDESVVCCQQILKLDPLREEIHRALMELYLSLGLPAMAIRQYRVCHAALARDLGIEPMPETQALYARLTSGANPASRPATTVPPETSANESITLRQQLEWALRRLDRAEIQLHHMARRDAHDDRCRPAVTDGEC
jgi:DNA-binding SARP family transcriptional activator